MQQNFSQSVIYAQRAGHNSRLDELRARAHNSQYLFQLFTITLNFFIHAPKLIMRQSVKLKGMRPAVMSSSTVLARGSRPV
jgi:hypothetical protein